MMVWLCWLRAERTQTLTQGSMRTLGTWSPLLAPGGHSADSVEERDWRPGLEWLLIPPFSPQRYCINPLTE